MTIRKPLVVINGDIRELSASDTLTVLSISSDTYPVIRPSLNLDFSNSQVVDSRITFTRSSIATRVSNKGLIESVGSDVPRIDYDPETGECKGLLIEEARTNLLTYSEQFNNAAWGKTRVVVSAIDAAFTPDGSMSADRISEDTATGAHYVVGYLSYTAGNTYTLSVFAKAGEKTSIRMALPGAAFGVNRTILVNLLDGSYTTLNLDSPTQAGVELLNDGWRRAFVSYTAAASKVSIVTVICDLGGVVNNLASYTGDGTSGLYLWGAQLEVGSLPTSYIPTVASSVPRVADVAMMTGANFSSWYRQDEFSAVARFIGNAVGTHTVASWNNTTANEVIKLESVSGALTLSVTDGGVTQASISLGSVATGTSYIVAAAWKLNDIAASVNGAAVVTNIVATLPTPTQLAIGSVARIFGYPQRLTNAQLQALSTQ